MAYAVEVTIGTSQKLSVNYQSHEVQVGVTFRLEREDTDLLAVIEEKSAEVGQAYHLASEKLRAESSAPVSPAKVTGKSVRAGKPPPQNTTQDFASLTPIPPDAKPEAQPTEPPDEREQSLLTTAQRQAIEALQSRCGLTDSALHQLLETAFNRRDVNRLTKNEAARLILQLSHRERERMLRDKAPPSNTTQNGTQSAPHNAH